MLEIMHGKSENIYRLKQGDPHILETRANKRGGRWHLYRVCASAQEAAEMLFALTQHDTEEPPDAHRP